MFEWVTTSSVLILIIMAIRYIFQGKIKLSMQYSLWLIVLIRLIIPVPLLNSNISVMNIFLKILTEPKTQRELDLYKQEEQNQSILNAQSDNDNAIPNIDISNPNKLNYDSNKSNNNSNEQNLYPNKASQEPYIDINNFDVQDTGIKSSVQASTLNINILFYIWIIGMISVTTVLTISALCLNKKLIINRKKFEYKDSLLPVYLSNIVSTPCMFGILHPSIYITFSIQEDEKRLRYVVCHENTHYNHKDHIWSIMRSICIILHWYNPLVWLAAALSRRDAELACDEETIHLLGENERLNYGDALIYLAEKNTSVIERISCISIMSSEKRHIKERITMIAKKPKQIKSIALILISICVLAVIITFTGIKEDSGSTIDEISQNNVQNDNQNNNQNNNQNDNQNDGKPTYQIIGQNNTSLPDDNTINNTDSDVIDSNVIDQSNDEQVSTQIMGYIGYTGYLDECIGWTFYQDFIERDYDGDSLIDRVYRWENDYKCSYRIEFGNGDILEFEDESWSNGLLYIQSADLTGDGINEIIVSHTYEFSTGPTSFGEFTVCRKQGNSYEIMELPFEKEENNFSQFLKVSCENIEEDFYHISCAETDFDITVQVDELSNIEQYKNYSVTDELEVVYTVAVDTSDTDIDKLVCFVSLFGRYSTDELLITLMYSEDAFYIEDIKYYDHYITDRTITIDNGRELNIQIFGAREYDTGLNTIKMIEISEDRDDVRYCIQSIWMSEDDNYAWMIHPTLQSWYKDFSIVIEDLNFDGYEDFRIQGGITSEEDTYYYCWLWDVDKQEFVYSFN